MKNRIVVDYGDYEGVVLLSAIHTKNGKELSYNDLVPIADASNLDIVKKYDGITDYNIIKESIQDDQEGRVVRFDNGFRMKIKGDEYIRLHYILTNISSRNIWQMAKDGDSIEEILVDVPDEFYDWATKTYKDLMYKFICKREEIENEFWTLIDKKEFAAKVKGRPNEHFLFRRLNSYSDRLEDMIWDTLYPDFSRPFNDKGLGNS